MIHNRDADYLTVALEPDGVVIPWLRRPAAYAWATKKQITVATSAFAIDINSFSSRI